MEKGDTSKVLIPFLEGMKNAGAEVELFYPNRLNIKPCACGEMYCWYTQPGNCCFKDDMQAMYAKLREAEILVLATPVYIPLPGAMQNFINRLCPLLRPFLTFDGSRTRAMFHSDVAIQRIALVSVGGWWEKENFDIVVQIAEELAKNASVEFSGAVLRPHAFLLFREGELTPDGKEILDNVKKAGFELASQGKMAPATLADIRRPLISEEMLRQRYNNLLTSLEQTRLQAG